MKKIFSLIILSLLFLQPISFAFKPEKIKKRVDVFNTLSEPIKKTFKDRIKSVICSEVARQSAKGADPEVYKKSYLKKYRAHEKVFGPSENIDLLKFLTKLLKENTTRRNQLLKKEKKVHDKSLADALKFKPDMSNIVKEILCGASIKGRFIKCMCTNKVCLHRPRETLIYHAVLNNKSYLVILLYLLGVNLDKLNAIGQAPIHYAVSERNIPMIYLLLELGASKDTKSVLGRTALEQLIDSSDFNSETEKIKYLLAKYKKMV